MAATRTATAVPGYLRGPGRNGSYHDEEDVEAVSLAKVGAAPRPGGPAIGRRRRESRRPASVDHEGVDLGRNKVRDLVKEMHA